MLTFWWPDLECFYFTLLWRMLYSEATFKILFFPAHVTVFTIPPSVKYFLISFQHKSATPWVWPTFLSIGLHPTSSPIHPGCLLSLQSWLIGFIDQRRVRMNPLQMQLGRTQYVLRDILPRLTDLSSPTIGLYWLIGPHNTYLYGTCLAPLAKARMTFPRAPNDRHWPLPPSRVWLKSDSQLPKSRRCRRLRLPDTAKLYTAC